MPIPIFPTLTVKPGVKKFGHIALVDPIHRVRYRSGAILTRPLFTDVPVKYNIFYSLMGNADKLVLEIWEKDTIEYGEKKFEFTNPQNDKTYETMLLKPIKYRVHSKSKGNIWLVKFDIITLSEI